MKFDKHGFFVGFTLKERFFIWMNRQKYKYLAKKVKEGTKLIFVKDGDGLSCNKGNVFTFSRWLLPDDQGHFGKNQYFKARELLELGNMVHGLPFRCCEIYNPRKHKDARIMNSKLLEEEHEKFVLKYGG